MNTEQALCSYIEELLGERASTRSHVIRSVDGLREGVKAEQLNDTLLADLATARNERDAARAEVERLKAAHSLSHPAADMAAATPSPLPAGVPVKPAAWVKWYRHGTTDGYATQSIRADATDQREYSAYYSAGQIDTAVAAAVAAEREAIKAMISTMAAGSVGHANAALTLAAEQIGKRGKP